MKRFRATVLVLLLAVFLPLIGHGQQPGPATTPTLADQFPLALSARIKLTDKQGRPIWLTVYRSELDDRLAVDFLRIDNGEPVDSYWQILPVGATPAPPAPGPTPPPAPPVPTDDAENTAYAAAMKIAADVRAADCPKLAALYKATAPTIGTQITTFAQWAAVTRSARQQMLADPARLAIWEAWSDELSKWLQTKAANYTTPAQIKVLNDSLQRALERAAK